MSPHMMTARAGRPERARRRNHARPRLEPLEGRALLAGWPWLSTPAGSLDTTFGDKGVAVGGSAGNFSRGWSTLSVQNDGAILLIGENVNFYSVHSIDNAIFTSRSRADGQNDQQFEKFYKFRYYRDIFAGGDTLSSLSIQGGNSLGDMKIIVSYYHEQPFHRTYQGSLVRLNSGGTPDPSFGSAAIPGLGSADDAAPWGHQIVVVGRGDYEAHYNQLGVARLNADGSPDNSFGSGGVVYVPEGPGSAGGVVAVLPDGTILVGGQKDGRAAVTVVSPGGSVSGQVSLPAQSGSSFVSALAIGPEGTVVAAGTSFTGDYYVYPSSRTTFVTRLNAQLGLDTSFGTRGVVNLPTEFAGLAVQPDGRIVVGGAGGQVTRLMADGRPDPSFGTGGTAVVALPDAVGTFSASCLGLTPDGNILLGGSVSHSYTTDFALVRLLGRAKEAPAPAVTPAALTARAPAGTWFSQPVFTFTVSNPQPGAPLPGASAFRAWVNWGDGTWSAGQVKPTGNGSFQVVGAHRYKKAGTYRTTSQLLGWPPGIVLAEVQGKVVAGGSARVMAPTALKNLKK